MKRFIIPFIYIVTLFAMSCEHKDLCVHHPHGFDVRIEFDWRNCPEVTPYSEENPSPGYMEVSFYPINNPSIKPITGYTIKSTGGVVTIPEGEYNIVCHNWDIAAAQAWGTGSFDTYHLFTRQAGELEGNMTPNYETSRPISRAHGTDDESVVLCPDQVYGCIATNVMVHKGKVGYTCYPEGDPNIPQDVVENDLVITLYPNDLICHYSYEVKSIINSKYITNASASLSGMAPTYHFATNEVGDEPVILPVGGAKILRERPNSDTVRLEGNFLTFGHHDSNRKRHKMMLYFYRSGKNGNEYGPYDVTEQVDTAPNPRRVHIVIDTVILTPPLDTVDGAFVVQVGDYIEVNQTIVMGAQ